MALPRNPLRAVFPIVYVQKMPRLSYTFLGTGFFINGSGLFLTAKHVCLGVEEDCNAVMVNPMTTEAMPYKISSLQCSKEFDIALGRVGELSDMQPLTVANENAPMNYDVLTAEFSGTHAEEIGEGTKALVFDAYFRKGTVLRYYMSAFPEKVPTGCLELSFPALKGASGAPVIVESTGLVIGMIVGNVERELLPAQIETVTDGQKYIEERKYFLPAARAISWKHLREMIVNYSEH